MNKIKQYIEERESGWYQRIYDLLPDAQSLLADMAYQGGGFPKKVVADRLKYQNGWNDCLKEMRAKIKRRKEFEEMNPKESYIPQTITGLIDVIVEASCTDCRKMLELVNEQYKLHKEK